MLINAAVSCYKLSNHGCLFLGVKMIAKGQLSRCLVPPSGNLGLSRHLYPKIKR